MKISLLNVLLLIAVIGLVFAFVDRQGTITQMQTELEQLQRMLPSETTRMQVQFSTKNASGGRSSGGTSIFFPGEESNRSIQHSVGGSMNGVSIPGKMFSAWIVGEVSLVSGFGKGQDTTEGVVVAICVSTYDNDTGVATDSETVYVVYKGVKMTAYENGEVKVVIRPVEEDEEV